MAGESTKGVKGAGTLFLKRQFSRIKFRVCKQVAHPTRLSGAPKRASELMRLLDLNGVRCPVTGATAAPSQ